MNESIKKAIAERAELETMRGAGKKHDHELVVTLYGEVDAVTGEVGGMLSFFRPQDFAVRDEWNYWRLLITHRGLVFLVHGYADVPISEDDMRGLAIDSKFPLMYDPPPMAPSDGLREDDFWNTEEHGQPRWWGDEDIEDDPDYFPELGVDHELGEMIREMEDADVEREIEADAKRAAQKLFEVMRKADEENEWEIHPIDTLDVDVGPCCHCGKSGDDVRNVLMMPFEAPVLGKGWGCFKCHLPMDGALTVLCDTCLEAGKEPLYVVSGQLSDHYRVEIATFEKVPFNHDMSKHPEASPVDYEEDTAEVETIILEEAEAAKKRLLLNEPTYIEVYRRVTFNEQGVKVEHLDAEDFESEWAEVNIPLHEDKTVYCVVCYIVGHPANQPAMVAMMMLNTIARELVHGVPGIVKLEGKW